MIHENDIYKEMLDEIENCNELARFKIASQMTQYPDMAPLKLLEVIKKIKENSRDGVHYYDE